MKEMKDIIKCAVVEQQANTESRSQLGKGKRLLSLATINRASGFTLIEVLVSIVILSIGALGVVSLQVNSIASQDDTKQMGSCGNLVYEALDLVRAGNGLADYGTTFTVTPSCVPLAPSDLITTNKEMICRSMHDMGIGNSTLLVEFSLDDPIAGVDTVTARNTYSRQGGEKTCASVLRIRQRN